MTDNYIKSITIDDDIPSANYYTKLPFFSYFSKNNELTFSSPVVYFVGENGTGKSTLLEAIAVAYGLNPEGGSKNFTINTRITHSSLHEFVTLRKSAIRPKDKYFYRAESFYNIATEVDRLEEILVYNGSSLLEAYGGISLHEQSHGESFHALLFNRFSGQGLYLLDEPDASLSPMKQLSLITRMNDLVHKNSQFIICTHSPILSAFPGAEIYEFSDTIRKIEYEESANYRITKGFLNSVSNSLNNLLND